jgi:tyrosine-protein phosphatase SIW14
MIKSKRTVYFVLFLFLLLNTLNSANCAPSKTEENKTRSEHWAIPIEQEGLPNLYKVSDALYRGAQPGKEAFAELKKLGIKTVVNLKRSNREQKYVEQAGLKYYNIPMFAFLPSKEKFARFLEIVSDPANQPVFVHCEHGADRTGAAVALYRIKIQHWDKEKAIDEMVNGGYNFHRIHGHLKNFVRKF